jgi:hypothetical protein
MCAAQLDGLLQVRNHYYLREFKAGQLEGLKVMKNAHEQSLATWAEVFAYRCAVLQQPQQVLQQIGKNAGVGLQAVKKFAECTFVLSVCLFLCLFVCLLWGVVLCAWLVDMTKLSKQGSYATHVHTHTHTRTHTRAHHTRAHAC